MLPEIVLRALPTLVDAKINTVVVEAVKFECKCCLTVVTKSETLKELNFKWCSLSYLLETASIIKIENNNSTRKNIKLKIKIKIMFIYP